MTDPEDAWPRDTWTEVCGDVAYEIHGPPPGAKPEPNWRDDPKEMERLYRIGAELFRMGILYDIETVKITGDYL